MYTFNATKQRNRIAANLSDVTPEQIGRCHKVWDFQTQSYKWLVLSETDNETEHEVRWSREHGYTCTCKSGQYGFANVKHPSGVDKHVRWVVAAEMEADGAFLDIATEAATDTEWPDEWVNPENETSNANGTRKHLLMDGFKECDDATYVRVMAAKPASTRGVVYSPKAFSILR